MNVKQIEELSKLMTKNKTYQTEMQDKMREFQELKNLVQQKVCVFAFITYCEYIFEKLLFKYISNLTLFPVFHFDLIW